jgi:hypothetical protein
MLQECSITGDGVLRRPLGTISRAEFFEPNLIRMMMAICVSIGITGENGASRLSIRGQTLTGPGMASKRRPPKGAVRLNSLFHHLFANVFVPGIRIVPWCASRLTKGSESSARVYSIPYYSPNVWSDYAVEPYQFSWQLQCFIRSCAHDLLVCYEAFETQLL